MELPDALKQHVNDGVFNIHQKAKRLVDNKKIELHDFHEDRYTFHVESTHRDKPHITSYDLTNRTGLCTCRYMQQSQGRCSHLTAAEYWIKEHIINEEAKNGR